MDDLLRDTLRTRAADPTAGCLDPETAAAFVDGTMSARARSGAETHVADCPRCQAVLAALVRSTPPPIERAWWRRPAVAWLAPLTVAATAVAIWISVPDTATPPPVQTLRDEAALLESSPVQPLPVGAPAAPQARSQLQSAARLAAAEAERAREKTAAAFKVQAARVTQDPLANSGGVGQVAAAAPEPVAAPPAPATAPPAAAAAPEAARADAANSAGRNVDQVTVSGASPVVTPTESVAVATFRSVLPPTIVSSNRISQWRVRNGGEVQHSTDGGKTWGTQATGVNATFAAGSSPSPAVCWLVGPGGLVLITTDEGRSWRRVAFPVVTDLVSIRATNDRTASVVTSDGRTFVTSDGGRNWRR